MFINTITNAYPYSEWHLKRDNPQTSFPSVVSDSVMRDFGVEPVCVTQRPDTDAQHVVYEVSPEFQNNEWHQRWAIRSKTQEEINSEAMAARAQRDQLLMESDWTQLPDAPVNQVAWAAYRQLLRDVPSQVTFPTEIAWPTKP